jgi:hypothetical protein
MNWSTSYMASYELVYGYELVEIDNAVNTAWLIYFNRSILSSS